MASTTDIARVSITREEYERLQSDAARIPQLERDVAKLSDELALLVKRLFGRSSERLDPAQLALFADASVPSVTTAPVEDAPRKRRAPGHGRPSFPEHLPREVIELDVSDEQKTCSECGTEMACIGEDVTERGHLVPARMLVKRYVRKKYACKAGHGVAMPALPATLVDKGKYEPSVYAHLAVAKYGDHIPLHRLEGIFKRHGVKIPKSSMWGLLVQLDEIVAQPVLAQMRRELLDGAHMQADETPVTVRLEDGKGTRPGYVWTYAWAERVLFDFTMTRQRDGPKRFLGDWSGTLQIDGYSAYDEVARTNGIVRAGCWSHARRKVFEAAERGDGDVVVLLRAIGRLFAIERAVRGRAEREGLDDDATCALRGEVRARRSCAVLDAIDAEASRLRGARSTVPKSARGKALTYLDNQWHALVAAVDDPALDMDNNDAERALRHVVTGRKNWMFFGSKKGGEVGARLFSLVASAKAAGVDPEAYLEDVIGRVSTTPASRIGELTPWAWGAAREAAEDVDIERHRDDDPRRRADRDVAGRRVGDDRDRVEGRRLISNRLSRQPTPPVPKRAVRDPVPLRVLTLREPRRLPSSDDRRHLRDPRHGSAPIEERASSTDPRARQDGTSGCVRRPRARHPQQRR